MIGTSYGLATLTYGFVYEGDFTIRLMTWFRLCKGFNYTYSLVMSVVTLYDPLVDVIFICHMYFITLGVFGVLRI